MKEEKTTYNTLPSFWIVTGISIYAVVNFPIFLFYNKIMSMDEAFAMAVWNIHNVSYIILCMLFAKAFHESKK
jgi:hypothetical protein